MKHYDVIVIGLGPAGSTAARELARLGHRVLALEKEKIPRYKPCGGCLSRKIENLLDEDFMEVVEETIYKVVVTFKGEEELEIESDSPLAYMVMRDRFDEYLSRKAEEAGATIHDGEPVKGVEITESGYTVYTSRRAYSCDFLVGADGVNGITSSFLNYGPERTNAIALEGEVRVQPGELPNMRGTVRLDVGTIPQGYGWIFPKLDHWSLGVGTVKAHLDKPKSRYAAFKEEQGISKKIESEKLRGFRIPLFTSRTSTITRGRSLLAGDAAALVDPFLGEGIYYAVRSGQLAAESINDAIAGGKKDLSSYAKKIDAEMYGEFEAAQKIARFGYNFPRLGFALFKASPEMREATLKLLRGELSYEELWKMTKKGAASGLSEFVKLLLPSTGKTAELADRTAEKYDAALFLWNQYLGDSPRECLEDAIVSSVRDGALVLNAGARTGETVKMLLKLSNPARVIAVDPSERMLEIARRKIKAENVDFSRANLTELPYPDETFDVVISAWAIETLPDPAKAVSEFLRVIKSDGYVIYIFASAPPFGFNLLRSSVIESLLLKTFDRRLLPKKERPYHDCNLSSLITFGNGDATLVILRKCCTVGENALPCRVSRPR